VNHHPSLLLAASVLLGCQFTAVNLGSNDAGSTDASPVVTSDCPTVSEAEINALYGSPCAATCTMTGGAPRVVTSSTELVAVTAGRWLTCGGDVPWAQDIVGIDFQPGCTLFLLHDPPDGGVARGVLPDEQGTFNVVTTTSGGVTSRALDLFFPAWTWRVEVTTSDCPHRMHWQRQRAGTETDFVGIPSASGSGPVE
jgi:hypothetical protein